MPHLIGSVNKARVKKEWFIGSSLTTIHNRNHSFSRALALEVMTNLDAIADHIDQKFSDLSRIGVCTYPWSMGKWVVGVGG